VKGAVASWPAGWGTLGGAALCSLPRSVYPRCTPLGFSSDKAQRALKTRFSGALLLDSTAAERSTLRPDLLQNLERGHLVLAGVPGYPGCLSVRVSAEPPVRADPFPGMPEELIEYSRRRFGKIPDPSRSPDVPPSEPDDGDEDASFVVIR
jgi:hypothetical protein